METLSGGCHCGAVRYEAKGPPFQEANCHCSICRRTTGAPFVAWLSVPRTGFRFTHGSPTRYPSSSHASRTFCATCGTQLTFESERAAAYVDLTIASLDAAHAWPPKAHIYVADKLPWMRTDDGLPQYLASKDAGD